ELFGHAKGSFTGAIENKKGLIELAEGGTLFMDELGEMPLDMQVKLLRVLENRELRSVGAAKLKKIDVRFIFATNKNIEDMFSKGTFREDLYYRINVVNISLPPLSKRVEDIPLLVGSFLNKYSTNENVKTVDEDTMKALKLYPWPGNIRELQNKIQRATILTDKRNIMLSDIFSNEEISEYKLTSFTQKESKPVTVENLALNKTKIEEPEPQPNVILPHNFDLEKEVEKFEAVYIKEALLKSSGNLPAAAKLLNLTVRAIRYKIKKYNIHYAQLTNK
ncbi:MAG: sigma-54-dependent Fis family transcriptional regulator, partial [Phycisphaeraceae bacterium]|nr:sigma-54-dependent Fis family transcriptional regulator [Phycisphaeraceae bacterium]